jgi:hypothetical protein
MPTWII